MAQFQFNATQFTPRYEASDGLPPGRHPVVIAESEFKPTKDGQGQYLALKLTAIDGPAKGLSQTDRLNLAHGNPATVAIAMGQLAAYCAVLGKQGFNATEELYNIPFIIEVGPQKNGEYTEVKAIFDIHGNKPGHQGGTAAAPQQAAQAQQPTPFVPQQQAAAQPSAQAPWGAPNVGQPAVAPTAFVPGATPPWGKK